MVRSETAEMPWPAEFEEFHTFGVTVCRRTLTPHYIDQMWHETRSALDRFFAHAPFDGRTRQWLPMLRADCPLAASLVEDDRFLGTARSLLGDVVLMNADASRRVGDTDWHIDSDDQVRGVRFAMFQQPVGPKSGGLRFIPGSHRPEEAERYRRYFARRPPIESVPAFAPELEPGDVVMFDVRIRHAAWGSSADRRMWTVTYFERPADAQARAALQGRVSRLLGLEDGGRKFQGRDAAVIDEQWVAAAATNDVRRGLIADMRSNGVFPDPGPV